MSIDRAEGPPSSEPSGRGERRGRGTSAAILALALLAALVLGGLFALDAVSGGLRARAADSAPFVVEPEARAALGALWHGSVEAKEERVACLAGRLGRRVFRIERAEAVPGEAADSAHVTPGPSLDRCGPPEWAGTAHTHIIVTDGGRPYATLSPPDRAVMRLWRERWRAEGLFCVLYSEARAYCEYGSLLRGDLSYAPGEGTGPGEGGRPSGP